MVDSEGITRMTNTEMLTYALQVGLCVAVLYSMVGLFSIPQPLALLPLLWGLGVIIIAWRFGDDQHIFYSSDQAQMITNISTFERDGFSLHPEVLLGRRDMITVPAWVLWKSGIHPLLALKFLQAVSLLLTIRAVVAYAPTALREALNERRLLWLFLIGPSLWFNSLLGLRDQVLVAGVTWFYTSSNPQTKAMWLIVITLLRPHLGVAVLLSTLVIRSISVPNHSPIKVAVKMVASFTFGVLLYGIGYSITGGKFSGLPVLVSQDRLLRLLAAFSSLNFLVVDSSTVDQSFSTLFLARIVFFDTWLIPLTFLGVVLIWSRVSSMLERRVLVAFSLFAGISSETDFISSRQLTPFFPVMALIGLAGVLRVSTRRSRMLSSA